MCKGFGSLANREYSMKQEFDLFVQFEEENSGWNKSFNTSKSIILNCELLVLIMAAYCVDCLGPLTAENIKKTMIIKFWFIQTIKEQEKCISEFADFLLSFFKIQNMYSHRLATFLLCD